MEVYYSNSYIPQLALEGALKKINKSKNRTYKPISKDALWKIINEAKDKPISHSRQAEIFDSISKGMGFDETLHTPTINHPTPIVEKRWLWSKKINIGPFEIIVSRK